MSEFVYIVQEHDNSGLCLTHKICSTKENADALAKEINEDLENVYKFGRHITVEKYFLD